MALDDGPLTGGPTAEADPSSPVAPAPSLPSTGAGHLALAAGHGSLTLTVFSVLWALSVVLHVYASAALDGVLHGGGGMPGLAAAVVSVAALALLALPGRTAPLLVVCAATVVSAVVDAPVIGNHWVLQAMVSLGMLLAAAQVWWTGGRSAAGFSRDRFAALTIPLVRASLLCFYVFAGFAKVNSSFLDSTVSCANVFADGSLRSFGLPAHLTGGSGWVPRALPVAAMVTELSVPVLLIVRRTRPYGIALALLFHSLVSADRNHPIGDFGSYLLASFVLFMPEAFFVDVAAWVKRHGDEMRTVSIAVLVTTGALVFFQANGRGDLAATLLEQGRWLLWIALDLTVVVVVLSWQWRHRRQPGEVPPPVAGGSGAGAVGWPRQARWLLVIPALIVLNGLTPYLELKTAYGWNMYSNLRTVDGDSNHLLIRRSLPLTDVQADMVEIQFSSDPGLEQYAQEGFALPMLQLRAYLADRPDTALRYVRGGETIDVAHASDRPELVRPVNYWEQRLLAFRASTLPADGPEVCQPTWLPAH